MSCASKFGKCKQNQRVVNPFNSGRFERFQLELRPHTFLFADCLNHEFSWIGLSCGARLDGLRAGHELEEAMNELVSVITKAAKSLGDNNPSTWTSWSTSSQHQSWHILILGRLATYWMRTTSWQVLTTSTTCWATSWRLLSTSTTWWVVPS